MSKNINKILLIIVIVLVLILIGIIVKQTLSSKSPSYYAVYLKTGELYFGKLSIFPSFKLSNVYLLQYNSQNAQNPISIQKFSNVFWGPEDYIKINKDEVVWYTKISSQSQLLSFLEGNLRPQQSTNDIQPQQPTANQNDLSSTSTNSSTK